MTGRTRRPCWACWSRFANTGRTRRSSRTGRSRRTGRTCGASRASRPGRSRRPNEAGTRVCSEPTPEYTGRALEPEIRVDAPNEETRFGLGYGSVIAKCDLRVRRCTDHANRSRAIRPHHKRPFREAVLLEAMSNSHFSSGIERTDIDLED